LRDRELATGWRRVRSFLRRNTSAGEPRRRLPRRQRAPVPPDVRLRLLGALVRVHGQRPRGEFVLFALAVRRGDRRDAGRAPGPRVQGRLLALIEVGILAHFAGGLVNWAAPVSTTTCSSACATTSTCTPERVRRRARPDATVSPVERTRRRLRAVPGVRRGPGARRGRRVHGVRRHEDAPESRDRRYADTVGDLVANIRSAASSSLRSAERWSASRVSCADANGARAVRGRRCAAGSSVLAWRQRRRSRRRRSSPRASGRRPLAERGHRGFGASQRVRGVVTRPLVDLVAARWRRRRVAPPARDASRSWDLRGQAIARLRDEDLPPRERAVWRIGSRAPARPRRVAALAEALRVAPPDRRAFLVQLVGSTGDPSVAPQIRQFIDDPTARGRRSGARTRSPAWARCDPAPRGAARRRSAPTSGSDRSGRGLGTTGAPEARAALAAVSRDCRKATSPRRCSQSRQIPVPPGGRRSSRRSSGRPARLARCAPRRPTRSRPRRGGRAVPPWADATGPGP